jgi:hypothetical protein
MILWLLIYREVRNNPEMPEMHAERSDLSYPIHIAGRWAFIRGGGWGALVQAVCMQSANSGVPDRTDQILIGLVGSKPDWTRDPPACPCINRLLFQPNPIAGLRPRGDIPSPYLSTDR